LISNIGKDIKSQPKNGTSQLVIIIFL